MADPVKVNTGTPQDMAFACAAGNNCWALRAFRLQEEYFEALKKLDAENNRWRQRLEEAHFLHEVSKAAVQSKSVDADEIWGNMRPQSGRKKEPSKFEETFLNEDIKRMEKAIAERREVAEKSCEQLIALLKMKGFQRHLLEHHSTRQIAPDAIKNVYHLQVEPPVKGATIKFREIDHYLALLTEHLTATKSGREFLDLVLTDDWVQKNVAFADIWGYTSKANSLTEPVGKFFYNVSPVIVAKVQRLINDGKVKSIDDILRDPDLKKHFSFLKNKLQFDVSGWLKKRADKFADRAVKAREYLERSQDWKNSVKEFQDVMEDLEAQKALDNAWVGITLDTVAFVIAVVKIAADFKKVEWKDWMGLVGDFTGMVKTVAEVRQSQILLRAGQGESLNAAKAFAKRLGILAGVAAVIILVADIYKGIKGSNWDEVALNSAGLLITGVGIYAAFMEMALLSGICTVLAVVLAIITALVVDAAVVNYIEDTYWGEDYADNEIPIGETIREYYKRMFSMYLRFVVEEYDSNESFIQIECGLLADSSPVFVEVIEESGKRSLGRLAIYPGSTSCQGKGKIVKEKVSWDEHWPFYAKRLQIHQAWDIWGGQNGIKRDAATKYTILAGLDHSRDAKMAFDKMAQHEETTGVRFPSVQKPILWSSPPPNESFYGSQVTYVGSQSTMYIPYPTSGCLDVHAFTRYGSGCNLRLRAVEDRTFPLPDRDISTLDAKVEGDKTIVKMPIKAPPRDDYMELQMSITLLDGAGKQIKTVNPPNVRIAYQSYINKIQR